MPDLACAEYRSSVEWRGTGLRASSTRLLDHRYRILRQFGDTRAGCAALPLVCPASSGESTGVIGVVPGSLGDMSEGVAASDEQAPVETADRWVGTLELFFDLVFVYAMSQVTILMLADISWAGFGCGLLTLAALIPVAVFGPIVLSGVQLAPRLPDRQ